MTEVVALVRFVAELASILCAAMLMIPAKLAQPIHAKPFVTAFNSPQVAIIVDDLGNNLRGSNELFKIRAPLTVAIMPFLPTSRADAIRAHQVGFEVLLHIPMEPTRGRLRWLGPGAITTKMSDRQIKDLVAREIDSIPFVVGVNNHMGSRATADRRVVEDILSVVREKHLFVVDSRTTMRTQFVSIARRMGIPSASRTVFLDNANNLPIIKRQIQLLMDYAKTRHEAIGIGHVGMQGLNTCKGIESMLPRMKSARVSIVPVSRLVHS